MYEAGRPLSFAHRGASYHAPANTLAAFLAAIDLGADGIEFDAHLSKDKQVVVIHDFVVDGTTDGHGLVQEKTLAELKELDAGSWFHPSFAGERIPTLQEVIDAVGSRLLLNIELKVRGLRDDGLAAAVVRHVEENHLLDRVILSSFSRLAVRRVKQLNSRIPTGLLYMGDPLLIRRPWPAAALRPEAVHPYYRMIDGRYVRWAREQGYRIHPWTVDAPGEMERLAALGVDLIITNRPDLLRQVLQSR
jgi:glycerophosphoryl diester phosphodiesterase